MSAPDTGRRTLGLVVVGLLVAALALWGASRGTWVTVTWSDPLRGDVVASGSGAETEPVLVPWALLALAAVAGVLATAGWGRRVVGAVVALAGLVALWRAVVGLAAPPPEAIPAAARRPGVPSVIDAAVVWPLLAACGALLLVAIGAVVAWRGGALPRLGARYDAPGTPGTARVEESGAAGAGARSRRPADPDQQLWDALDEGRDPTAEAEEEARRGGQT